MLQNILSGGLVDRVPTALAVLGVSKKRFRSITIPDAIDLKTDLLDFVAEELLRCGGSNWNAVGNNAAQSSVG
jgi:hypothetical protein